MAFTINFVSDGSLAECESNPEHPDGKELDTSHGAAKTCTAILPYPAPSRGMFMLECQECAMRVGLTAAGRRDDPRSIKLACRAKLPEGKTPCMRNDCETNEAARWQVSFRIWLQGDGGHTKENANIGMTTLAVCDACRAKCNIEELMDTPSKVRIAHSFGARGLPPPDFDATQVDFIEITRGRPFTLEQMQEAAEPMAVPPGKRH